jgi:hypothetical protein
VIKWKRFLGRILGKILTSLRIYLSGRCGELKENCNRHDRGMRMTVLLRLIVISLRTYFSRVRVRRNQYR